jgi:hypothetical protein
MCDGSVYLVMLPVLCCGRRFESRGGPAPCLLGDGGSDDPTTSARPRTPAGAARSSGGLLRYPILCETNPRRMAGGVKFVAGQSAGEIG